MKAPHRPARRGTVGFPAPRCIVPLPSVAAQGRRHEWSLMIFMKRERSPRGGPSSRRVAVDYHAAMTLRLKINLIVGALTALFVLALLVQQLDDDRQSVNEEVTAAHRVALQMLNRVVWSSAAQGPQVLLAYLRGMGRVRSNDIGVYDGQGALMYRSPASTYKPGRSAPAWFERLVAP